MSRGQGSFSRSVAVRIQALGQRNGGSTQPGCRDCGTTTARRGRNTLRTESGAGRQAADGVPGSGARSSTNLEINQSINVGKLELGGGEVGEPSVILQEYVSNCR